MPAKTEPKTRLKRRFTAEQKQRIMDLLFKAIAMGWSVQRFCRLASVARATVGTWITEDAYFDRYRRAMADKALSLPDKADDVVRRLINPSPAVVDDEGKVIKPSDKLEAKEAGVALRHYEFRLMREFKGGVYAQQVNHNHKHVHEMTDDEIEQRYEELAAKAAAEARANVH